MLVQVNHSGHVQTWTIELKPDATACTPRGQTKPDPSNEKLWVEEIPQERAEPWWELLLAPTKTG